MEASKIIFYLCIIVVLCNAEDRIFGNQTIIDQENSTIQSAGGHFELGFFSPGKSKNRYLGIWYKSISTGTVVWVANRETPLTDKTGVLRVDENGRLILRDGVGGIIWSSNSSRAVKKPMCQLLDTGNLVIGYEDETEPSTYLWQSFDHPGDHLLPGMKLGWDLRNGLNRYLNSWRSPDDPSPGIYTMRINLDGFPQPILWNGSVVQLRWGPWDGFKFSGISFSSIPNPTFLSNFIVLQTEIYYQFGVSSESITTRSNLNPDGSINLLFWIKETQSWRSIQHTRMDDCDRFAFCGANGICNIANKPSENGVCGCLEGFEPKFPERWKAGNWSDGCVRRTALGCGHGDRFNQRRSYRRAPMGLSPGAQVCIKPIRILIKPTPCSNPGSVPGFNAYVRQKLPDTRRAWFNHSMNLEDCKIRCLNNCSCTAYSNIDVRGGGVGCMIWLNDLLDIRDYREDGPNLYVRLAASESGKNRGSRRKNKLWIVLVVVSLVLIVLVSSILTGYVLKKRKLRRKGFKLNSSSNPKNNSQDEDLDLPLYDFPVIAIATSHFSEKCKLGEGGFGSVYKGIMKDGKEIAVKRLAKNSRQGLDEFKNEISCIAKLQHRNLVKLLGYCIEKDEMLLLYEYMPNYSLDYLLFDKERRQPLDWPKRYNIINGIARGLLYLHQDSRLRVIHRDLKASNILLDVEMNPRISDFGLARIFWGSESEANTTKVVGTYGYMSPEYALDGIFSTKSDVYSFGVLVLEIVSGMKMRGFYHLDTSLNLLSHAWRLYQEEKCPALLDEAAIDSCNQSELFRAIQVGLLCVQPYPEDRPSMSTVVLMLSSDNELPQPKQPTFFTERNQYVAEFSSISEISTSASSVFTPR